MKTLTRIKNGITGEEYYIGKQGNAATVIVTLNGDDTITDWTKYKVTYTDVTASKTEAIALDADGTCKFDIPFGDTYKVTLPTISGYPVPTARTYTASNLITANYITFTYTKSVKETVDIYCYASSLDDDTTSILVGQTITCRTTSLGTLSATLDSAAHCSFVIPYGDTYTLTFPTITGYTHGTIDSQVAGVARQSFSVQYLADDTGVFAIDASGNHYSQYDLEAKTQEERDALGIVAIGLVNSKLSSFTRGDGTTGCCFCIAFEDKSAITAKQWANANYAFNPNLLPYKWDGSGYTADGSYLTQLIQQIAQNEEVGTWELDSATGQYKMTAKYDTAAVTTAAATYCNSKTLTINGVEKTGFLPSYQQIQHLAYNYQTLAAIYSLLGKTVPTITSGYWWTSCQSSSAYAVGLYNGRFSSYIKSGGNSVLVCFDL